MKLEQSFEVAAPLDRVWKALIDVEHVAPCLPGAAITGRNDDGSYGGAFTVKIGPTTASYTGKLEMQKIDDTTHTATMHAHGNDKRGQGGATADIVSTLSPADDQRTRVEVITDYHITGRLARFGRGGMIEDISNKLLRQFAQRLQASLVAEPGGAGAASAGAGGSVEATAAPGNGDVAPAAATVEPSLAASQPSVAAAQPSDAASQPSVAAAQPPQPSEPVGGLSLVSSVLWDRVRRNPVPLAFVVGVLLALVFVRRASRARR